MTAFQGSCSTLATLDNWDTLDIVKSLDIISTFITLLTLNISDKLTFFGTDKVLSRNSNV